MNVLKSNRDAYFLEWNEYHFKRDGTINDTIWFDFVPIKKMQRGDITPKSKEWLKENKKQNTGLNKHLSENIPRGGMNSPLVLLSVNHQYWKDYLGKIFWASIPFVIKLGNNRYQYAIENKYTHISSVCLGKKVDPKVWKYLEFELTKPLTDPIFTDIEVSKFIQANPGDHSNIFHVE